MTDVTVWPVRFSHQHPAAHVATPRLRVGIPPRQRPEWPRALGRDRSYHGAADERTGEYHQPGLDREDGTDGPVRPLVTGHRTRNDHSGHSTEDEQRSRGEYSGGQ